MQVFIGGVMQASTVGRGIVDQAYRGVIANALRDRWPDLEIIDPLVLHPGSVEYDDTAARETLLSLLALARDSQLVIAYVPEASMGTALEIYEAHLNGIPIISISPMAENWVIRSFSRRIFRDMQSFLAHVKAAARPEDLLNGA